MLLIGSQFRLQFAWMHAVSDPIGSTRAPNWGAPQHRGQTLGTSLSSASSREGGNQKRRASAEDAEIGRKIRALRLERGLSQTGLADGIGLTFQQVQKYEKGTNRVSAGRLQTIADMLNTPVMFFYGGSGAQTKTRVARNSGLALIQTKGAMRLMRAYAAISSRTTKHALIVLAESLKDKERK
jgi:transcriptional regulator with XRE-family HTH domain